VIGEINLYGVFVPAILICAAAAFPAAMILRAILRRVGFYRLVWHPALFDLALFVIVLGGVVALTSS
jgi:hypothetical protein